MRILQISSARSIGGGERHLIDLSNELTKRGHDVFIGVIPGSPLPDALDQIPSDHIAEFPLRNALDVPTAVRIGRFARDKKIELINAHFAKDYPVTAAAARIVGVPLILTRHVLFPMNGLHRIFLRDVRYVIAPSNAVSRSLRAQGLFSPEKIVTIRYGLDIDRFPERPYVRSETLRVGSVGNLDPVKGFDIFIRAAEIVSKEISGVRFKIVGEDRSRDGRNENDLRRLIGRANLHDTVELAGWSSDIADVLSDIDIFVSASRSESFGFVIAEAMLSGVPVIATETEGAKEIISDPSLGRLVPVASVEHLAEAILELISNRSRREQLMAPGRDHIINNFSLKRMADETEALYKRVVGRDSDFAVPG